jgi:hypothetical protein
MSYVKSKDIQLFPSSFRGQYDSGTNTVFNPGSRLTSEYNLTSLVTSGSRIHQSYVVEYDASGVDKLIVFRLKGYFFAVKMSTYLASFTTQIWAKINLANVAGSDINNTVDTAPVLRPIGALSSIILDQGTAEGNFLGLDLVATEPTPDSGIHYFLILEKVGSSWVVPEKSYFKNSATEISNFKSSTVQTVPISSQFDTTILTAGTVNKLTITAPTTSATLTILDGKTLTVNDSVTLAGTGTATFNKNLTVSNDNAFTLVASGDARTLTISGANKQLAGAGTSLTINNSLVLAGSTGTVTLGTGSHTLTLTTTANTNVTLPTTGTLSTLGGTETLTNKTLTSPTINSASMTTPTLGVATATSINKVTITAPATSSTLTIVDGKTLTDNVGLTVGATSTNTGAVTVRSTGTDATVIEGPTGATATLVSGTMVSTTGTQTLTNKTLTSPTLTTPSLGVASATSINKVTITAPTTSAILTIANGKTLTANNSIILEGTDLATATIHKNFTVSSSGGTVTLRGNAANTSELIMPAGSLTLVRPSLANGVVYASAAGTYAMTGAGTSGQVLVVNSSLIPTFADSSSTFRANTATTLHTPRTLWGQSFNGSVPISGSLTSVGNIERSTDEGTYNIGGSNYPFTNIYSTNFFASSDARLKENITDYQYKNSILDIKVKEFDYKETGVHAIGFIAQELQEKFPELVTSEKDGYLSIAENKLVYLLLEEVKLLKEEIRKLKE